MKEKEPQIVKELTPELSEKIWKSIQRKRYDDKVTKERVLHHLKQIKAQIGKKVKRYEDVKVEGNYQDGLNACMYMIDKKITKIKEQ